MIEVGTVTTYVILLLVPLIAGLLGYSVFCFSSRTDLAQESADRLLNQLYKLHRISYPHQTLLQSLAEAAEIANPAVLFVIPDEFEAAVVRAAEDGRLSDADQKSIGQLRRQLFG